jgi:truncated hemoglobin YjbI/uncharacterized protein YndB with AHSA1/START domain
LTVEEGYMTPITGIDEQAPVVSETQIEILAAPELVWEALTDFAHWPSWNPDVKSMSIEGAVAEGTVFRWKAGPGTITSTIQRAEPPSLIAWTGKTLGIGAIHFWWLEARGGATVVRTAESYDGLVARLFRRPLQRALDNALEDGLRHLKTEVERSLGSRADEHEPTLFEWAGGFPALTRMTRIFYGRYVPEDPLLSELFANMAPDHPERVAAWLGETFGGPKRYSEDYGGYDRMVSRHLGTALTEEQRARWVQLLCRSADDAGLPTDPEWRAAFVAYLEWGSRIALENSQPGAHPPPHMPVPRWWWVCDATPGSRVSALATEEEEQPEQRLELPGSGEPVGFELHVKPLFRQVDRQSMRFAFDLWSHEDVAEHADAILGRLRAGSMPCDGAWPDEQVEVFARWIESAKPE